MKRYLAILICVFMTFCWFSTPVSYAHNLVGVHAIADGPEPPPDKNAPPI